MLDLFDGLPGAELLTAEEMYRADAWAVAHGVPGIELMENAGRVIADAICARLSPRPVAVLCGPGNNGGDGFVAARLLAGRGWPVRLFLLGARTALKGDAALAAARWEGPVEALDEAGEAATRDSGLVIDALFGAGLTRPLEGVAAALARASHRRDAPVHVAVDVPSGIDGTTGAALGDAFRADMTVSFFRAKPGHFLLPGRIACGELVIGDIGIEVAALAEIAPRSFVNLPGLWRRAFPRPAEDGHKYRRGHAVVVSGPPTRTGAARLAARGALRMGAGLVTVACPPAAAVVNAAHLTAIMVAEVEGPPGLSALLDDPRHNALLIGPGAGVNWNTRAMTLTALRQPPAMVLDADALTSFAAEPEVLWRAMRAPTVITPHEGEFVRVFPDIAGSGADKPTRARAAAARAHAVVVLKGPDTVIASPDGRAAINANAPPTLATAGSGDALAGFILGLLAQHVPPFEAACIGVWLHGAAAAAFGPGLIAEDLPEMLPEVLQDLEPALDSGPGGLRDVFFDVPSGFDAPSGFDVPGGDPAPGDAGGTQP